MKHYIIIIASVIVLGICCFLACSSSSFEPESINKSVDKVTEQPAVKYVYEICTCGGKTDTVTLSNKINYNKDIVLTTSLTMLKQYSYESLIGSVLYLNEIDAYYINIASIKRLK